MVDDASVDRGWTENERNSISILFSFHLEYLKDTLERYVQDLPVKVHILRNPTRLGLMKSRLKGTKIFFSERKTLIFFSLRLFD